MMKSAHPFPNRNPNRPSSRIRPLREKGLLISLSLLLLTSLACGLTDGMIERVLPTPREDPSPVQESAPAVTAVTSSPEKEAPSATNTPTPPPTSTPLPSGGPARRRICPTFLTEGESTNTSLKIVEKEFERFEYRGAMGELFLLDNGIGMIRRHPFFRWLEVVATSEDGMDWEYIPEKSRPHPEELGLKDVPPLFEYSKGVQRPGLGGTVELTEKEPGEAFYLCYPAPDGDGVLVQHLPFSRESKLSNPRLIGIVGELIVVTAEHDERPPLINPLGGSSGDEENDSDDVIASMNSAMLIQDATDPPSVIYLAWSRDRGKTWQAAKLPGQKPEIDYVRIFPAVVTQDGTVIMVITISPLGRLIAPEDVEGQMTQEEFDQLVEQQLATAGDDIIQGFSIQLDPGS